MNRRHLLRSALGLGLGLGLSAIGGSSVARASGNPKEQRAALSAALRSATQSARALLVIVIPEDDGEKWTRGQHLGEWLNSENDASLAPLAGVDVVCASLSDLRQLVPQLGKEEPWFVLMKMDAPVRVKRVTPVLPAAPKGQPNWGDEDFYGQGHSDWNKTRIAANVAAIDAVLHPALNELAPQIGSMERMATAVRAKIVAQAPAGAHWAMTGGCGTEVEGVESAYAVDCGMGHVPQGSQRLLYFLDVSDFQGF